MGLALRIHKSSLHHIVLIIVISFTFVKDSTDAIEAHRCWLQIHHDSVDTSMSTQVQSIGLMQQGIMSLFLRCEKPTKKKVK